MPILHMIYINININIYVLGGSGPRASFCQLERSRVPPRHLGESVYLS